MPYMPSPTPIEEVMESLGCHPKCFMCKRQIDEDPYYDGDDDCYFCETCVQIEIAALTAEARDLANANCKITGPVPKYDSSQEEYRCSPEDYEMGYRYSHTPNARLAFCRHACSNYDDLISDLDRYSFSLWNNVYYGEIYNRIMEMLKDAIPAAESGEHSEVGTDADDLGDESFTG